MQQIIQLVRKFIQKVLDFMTSMNALEVSIVHGLCRIITYMSQRYDRDITESNLSQRVHDLKFLVMKRVPERAPKVLAFIKKYVGGFINLGVALRL